MMKQFSQSIVVLLQLVNLIAAEWVSYLFIFLENASTSIDVLGVFSGDVIGKILGNTTTV